MSSPSSISVPLSATELDELDRFLSADATGDEAMMMEPTETESKETLDAFADALLRAAKEAHDEPALLRAAPTTTPVGRLDEARAARHLVLRW